MPSSTRTARSSRSVVLVAVVALVLGSLGFAGTAYSANLTAKQVKKIAAKVVKKKAPKLSVKHAKTADSATTAGNATNLGGLPPAAYLDRVAFETLTGAVATAPDTTQQIHNPTVINVPDGVGFVRVDAVASFTGAAANVDTWISSGGCSTVGDDYDHRQLGNTGGTRVSISVTRVYPVTAGANSFRMCARTSAASSVDNRSITIQTVAGDFNG